VTLVTDAPASSQPPEDDVMLGVLAAPTTGRTPRSRVKRLGRRLVSESGIVVALSFALYLSIAFILDFKTLSFNGDAVARMANGFYVLYSRDPHLAAIGFVWNPLQSILDIVPLLFKDLWPSLASHDMAGSLVSVVAMVGAVHQMRAALGEWGVQRGPRLVMTVLFAVNPMIMLYSGNGMSEAVYLFTLIATTRYLARWLRCDDLRSLVYAAVALGFCYLDRNEAVLPAFLALMLVLKASYSRGTGVRRARTMTAVTDGIIFVLPVVTAFVGWAVASYVITGQFFAQFTSQYGTSAQIAAEGGSGQRYPLGPELRLEAHALWYLAPLLVVIVVAALLVAWHHRDPLVLVPIAVVGGGLAFDLAGYVTNSIIWSFRYFIATVPLEVLLVGVLLAATREQMATRSQSAGDPAPTPVDPASAIDRERRWTPWMISAAGILIAVVALGPSVPATAAGMFNRNVGVEELQELGYVFHHPLTAADRVDKQHFATVQSISRYLAGLRLPEGDILVDNSSECVPEVITTVPDPKIFVIPNDRDFQRSLADPLTFNVHYIMVPPSSGIDVNTATNRLYPTLYDTGAGWARQVHQFPKRGLCPAFRLYRVVGHPPT
jgi:hypothetical protein